MGSSGKAKTERNKMKRPIFFQPVHGNAPDITLILNSLNTLNYCTSVNISNPEPSNLW